MKLSIEEQEVQIGASRDEEYATAYCSDSTWITKMDRLVKKAPDLFKVIAENEVSKTYSFPKSLISIRSKFVERNLSDEQRQKLSEQAKERFNRKDSDA